MISGSIVQRDGFECYVIGKDDVKEAIILYTDFFGLALVNNRLIADQLHEKTGKTVFVPDLFKGLL